MGLDMATLTKRRRLLDELYDQVPAIECRGLCADQCTVISVHPLELDAMCTASGRDLPVWPRGDSSLLLLPADNDRCPLLVDGRCSVYNARPMICRLFGAVEGMICKHGCKPADLLTDDEGFDLVTALSKL